jgi:hypothetical protein
VSHADVATIRASVGLGAREEAALRAAAGLLEPEVDAWVDRFYARLVVDPPAMALLADEGRVVRLKRSLAAWFRELLTLPFDEAYGRARERIGETHVRIGLPPYLIVAAMSGVRRDAAASVARLLAHDPDRRRAVDRAMEAALDLELALMLAAQMRRGTERALRDDAAFLGGLAARRVARRAADGVAAARCYGLLLRRAEDPAERALWAARLDESLAEAARIGTDVPADLGPPRTVSVRQVCLDALAQASEPGSPAPVLRVDPSLVATLHGEALRAAVTALVRAARASLDDDVRVAARTDSGALLVEVLATARVPPPREGEGADPLEWARLAAEVHGGRLEPIEDGRWTGWSLRLPGVVRSVT